MIESNHGTNKTCAVSNNNNNNKIIQIVADKLIIVAGEKNAIQL